MKVFYVGCNDSIEHGIAEGSDVGDNDGTELGSDVGTNDGVELLSTNDGDGGTASNLAQQMALT